MSEKEILDKWNSEHNAYATIDRNNNGQNKIIIARGNSVIIWKITEDISEEYLDRIFARLNEAH